MGLCIRPVSGTLADISIIQPISSAWGTSVRISSPSRLSFMKNGSFYDIDRGAVPDYTLTNPEIFYNREALAEYINTLP